MNFDITSALHSLRPNSLWVVRGDTFDGIEWLDTEQTCPSEEEIADEILRLQEEYDSVEYQRLRVKEYPSFAEQFDLLYHGGYDAWKSVIDEIKSKYPKP